MIKNLVCATLLSCACLTQTRDPFQLMDELFWEYAREYTPRVSFRQPMNIQENDKEFIVTVEAPGFQKEDLNINIEYGRILTISGKQQSSVEETNEENKMIYHGRGSKEFKYSQTLPDAVDENNIKNATLKNGILTITLQKAEKSKRSKIEITD